MCCTDQEDEVGVALQVGDLVDVRGDRLAADAHLLTVDKVAGLMERQPPNHNPLLRRHLITPPVRLTVKRAGVAISTVMFQGRTSRPEKGVRQRR